jgi:hypothetical protein
MSIAAARSGQNAEIERMERIEMIEYEEGDREK